MTKPRFITSVRITPIVVASAKPPDGDYYHASAEFHLKRCEEILEELHLINDSLEGRLDETLKPSEMLG